MYKKEEYQQPKTFVIHILYKENNTWQGRISYSQWKKDKSFTSFLHLLKIIVKTVNGEN